MYKSIMLSAVVVTLVQPLLMSAAEHRPNIILFVADDHGWADSGVYGDDIIQTPNIDRLAVTSMRFDCAFAASPLCSPSRCVIQTGLMPHRNGGHKFGTSINAGLKTMAAYFNEMGYQTAHFGKFHHASPKAWFPYAHINSSRDTRPAVGFLSSYEGDKPLFLVVCSYPPHTPWIRNTRYDPTRITLPPNFVDTPETRSDRADYYSDVTLMDSFLGDILEAAKTNGLYEDTLFIYTSDQGANWPFAKWCVYDQGLRVPFMARWPGKIAPGSTTDAMINLVDLLPTCIEIAGGSVPDNLDGRSFASVLLGQKSEHRKQIFGTHTGNENGDAVTVNHCPARTVRDRRFRYILNLDPETTFNTHITGCKSGPHHLPHWDSWMEKAKTDETAKQIVHAYQHRPAEELYDLEKDPYEIKNLAGDPQYRGVLEGMRKDLLQWRASQNDFEVDYR